METKLTKKRDEREQKGDVGGGGSQRAHKVEIDHQAGNEIKKLAGAGRWGVFGELKMERQRGILPPMTGRGLEGSVDGPTELRGLW